MLVLHNRSSSHRTRRMKETNHSRKTNYEEKPKIKYTARVLATLNGKRVWHERDAKCKSEAIRLAEEKVADVIASNRRPERKSRPWWHF